MPPDIAPLVKNGRSVDIGDAVRHAEIHCLDTAGFEIVPDPLPLNPDHALVLFDGDWNDEVAMRFEACFGPPIVEV